MTITVQARTGSVSSAHVDWDNVEDKREYWMTKTENAAGVRNKPDSFFEFTSDTELYSVHAMSTLGLRPQIEPCRFEFNEPNEMAVGGTGFISKIAPSNGNHTYRILYNKRDLYAFVNDNKGGVC